MREIKGLYFTNGIQALATIVAEDDYCFTVENMLALQINSDDPANPKLYFEDFTALAELSKTGLDTKVTRSTVMFTFPPEAKILAGYKARTSLILTR
jgi:hypothetical protein